MNDAFNKYFIEYAASLGLTPEEALAKDMTTFPGGCMTEFLCWLGRRLAQKNQAIRSEALDDLETMTRQSCGTFEAKSDYNGQVAGTKVTDSGAISTYASALRKLAEAKRFRIVAETGRMVVGYWPENDPTLTEGVAL